LGRVNLRARYKMVFGPDVAVSTFPTRDMWLAERMALANMCQWNICGELFEKSHLKDIEICVDDAAARH
jgi:hypothetical protein